ncbi:hypothetical protein CHS0354_023665 [Potamilus streckersoni]|uniref:Transmembrane protein n=1 Tax=Potamilus streckersoni TaxID=2493646 RepID=A0AAE0SZ12_9BIVA|nr:hypothetical protein CHS0354_023665 [Potamilus streckersoni]
MSLCLQAGCDSSKHKPRLSYPTRIKWDLPVEIVCKTLFPIGGFLAELFDGSPHFYDWQGNFTKLVYMQHMTIYGMFILHGIIDLLDFYRLPVIKGMNYMSVVLCFIWYGIAFYFHSQTHGLDKEPLEIIIHLLPIFLMFGCALAIFVEYVKGEGAIWPQLIRTFLVLNLGTWFTNAAFVLYVHDRFPDDF